MIERIDDMPAGTIGLRAFAWLAPGEVRIFSLGELDAARQWVAGGS